MVSTSKALPNLSYLFPSGKGGHGCVAFHRPATSPRQPFRLGPPSGGNGGRGGGVYLLPDESLTSLASVPRRVKGKPGTHGSGDWQNGRRGEDKVVRVPMGTVVKIIEWGNDVIKGGESDIGGIESERESRWVHYPGWAEANMKREDFREAEKWLQREEKRRMWEERRKWDARIAGGREIDLDAELSKGKEEVDTVNAPLGKKRKEPLGYLLASGGAGGLGNPHFCANLNTPTSSQSASAFARSPKFATRGLRGDLVTVSLELRTPADVALVGRCNAGKSTLIRALTGGRVKSDVGGWEGVTRDVVRGIVRVAQWKREGEQGWERVWEGKLGDVRVFDETMEIRSKKRANVNEEEEFSLVPTKPGHGFDLYESFRFMITDNPGFVVPTAREQSIVTEKDEGLAPITQTILRSIERAKVLVYVVDLSSDAPWDELQNVIQEVARGQGGGENKTRRELVVANKADLLVRAGEGMNPAITAEVAEAQAKLHRLEDFVHREMGSEVDVVPVSAKWGMNLGKVVRSLEELLKGQAN